VQQDCANYESQTVAAGADKVASENLKQEVHMGLFFEQSGHTIATLETFVAKLKPHIGEALRMPPDPAKEAEQSEEISESAARELLGGAQFCTGRFLIALLLFALLVVGGLLADIYGHVASSSSLYGFAGIVFGIVAAFLGVEKSATG
jgi:hypothetical protein